MTTVEILKEMAFTATETQRRALEDAISVLSTEGDLISRQAVENITWEEPSYSDPLNVLTEVREKVRALPSVENKGRGKWIDSSNGWTCSICNRDSKSDTDFCPPCGAKMKGGERMSDYISRMNTKKDDGFNEGYEQYYRDKFRLYLSGVQRYMMNKILNEEPYHGENGAIEHW